MAHLSNFGVGNFRAFKGFYNFKFAPITVLTGTNSSGKSSLIKAILLIKDAIEKNDNYDSEHYLGITPLEKVSFSQRLNLGNFSTVVNRESNSDIISITLPFNLFPSIEEPCSMCLEYIQSQTPVKDMRLKSMFLLESEDRLLLKLETNQNTYINNVVFSNFHSLLVRHDKYVADAEAKAGITDKHWLHQSKLTLKPLLNYLFLENINWIADHISVIYKHLTTDKQLDLFNTVKKTKEEIEFISTKEGITPEQLLLRFELSHLDRLNSDINLWGVTNPLEVIDTLNAFTSFDEIEEPSIYLRGWVKDYVVDVKKQIPSFCNELIIKPNLWQRIKSIKHENEYHTDKFFFDRIAKEFKSSYQNQSRLFKSMDYVSSVRTKVDRIYRVGSKDSNLDELLLEYLNTDFESGIIGWMSFLVKKIGIADKLEIIPTEDSAGAKIILTKDGRAAELADFGYGIAQLIPILLRLHMVINKAIPLDVEPDQTPHPHTIILEEPETNLHPSLQSKLADVFIECNKRLGIQFIIETHSEYLIRRLQRRTAEFYNENRKNEISIPTDYTQIYYFYPPDNVPEGEKQIYPINIQRDGALTKNFGTGFFDEAGNEDLLLYQIAKHNKN